MAFTVGDTTQTYQENCLNTDESHMCRHLMLEELGSPRTMLSAPTAPTTGFRGSLITELVEQMKDHYSTSHHCIAEGGKGNTVPYLNKVCPFCKGPKKDHIIKLVTMLATSLVGTNVPKERVPLDFDTRLFVAGAQQMFSKNSKCFPLATINVFHLLPNQIKKI